jgi:predicted HTH domain antitoxin
MQDVTLRLPGDSLIGVKIPPTELEAELRRRLAAALFSDGILSNAAACRMAGLEKTEFQYLLGERKVTRPLGYHDLEQDLANFEKWKNR